MTVDAEIKAQIERLQGIAAAHGAIMAALLNTLKPANFDEFREHVLSNAIASNISDEALRHAEDALRWMVKK